MISFLSRKYYFYPQENNLIFFLFVSLIWNCIYYRFIDVVFYYPNYKTFQPSYENAPQGQFQK